MFKYLRNTVTAIPKYTPYRKGLTAGDSEELSDSGAHSTGREGRGKLFRTF